MGAAVIEAFSVRNAHEFGDVLASQARLRYRVFVLNCSLPHHFYDGMEYDEFDTPAAVYLVWRDPEMVVRGLIRMVPTSQPYMLQTYWPHLCQTQSLPCSDDVWEATRVCVDKSYTNENRGRIMPELLCGVQEFCFLNDIRAVVGVTRKHLMSHFIRTGIQWLGEPAEIEGHQEVALSIPTDHIRPHAHCKRYGIGSSILSLEGTEKQRVAA